MRSGPLASRQPSKKAALAGAGDDLDALKRALLRAFDLGWRAGRAFEWEYRERAVRESSQSG